MNKTCKFIGIALIAITIIAIMAATMSDNLMFVEISKNYIVGLKYVGIFGIVLTGVLHLGNFLKNNGELLLSIAILTAGTVFFGIMIDLFLTTYHLL